MHLFPKRVPLQGLETDIFKLVSYGATPDQWAEWLRVPLEHAAARGNLDLVNILIEAGADGSAGWRGCRGRTLLDAAALGGSADVVTVLLRAGAKPDVTVVSMTPKRSALYVATVCGHEEAAKLLLSAGADARFEDPVDRFSVLHEAACGGHEQLVKDLLIADADPSRLSSAPSRISPLHQAALGGHPSIVSALLLKGADIDVLDRCGESPLIWAADEGQLAADEALLAAGANFNIRSTDRNNSGCAALDCAAFHGHAHILKAILAHGADANARDDEGLTALHTAAGADQAGIVEALIEEGADVDLMTDDGWTSLAFAACASKHKAMLALLHSGAVVNKCDANKKYTQLHSACCGRSAALAETVDLLLRWGADETALTTGGQIPAHLLDRPALLHEPHKPYGSDEDMKRARLLLARAEADRTWRRRSWLIMVRSRASKTTANDETSGNDGGDSNESAGRAKDNCKVAKSEGATGSVVQDVSGQALNGGSGGGVGAKGADLSSVVALLVGLELEGLFRTVVGFL